MQIFSSAGFILLSYPYIQNKPPRPPLFSFLFCFWFAHLKAQPHWFTVYQWRTEKCWLFKYFIFCHTTPALFISQGNTDTDCLAQNGSTHGWCCFHNYQMLILHLMTRTTNQAQNWWWLPSILFPSIGPAMLLYFSIPSSYLGWLLTLQAMYQPLAHITNYNAWCCPHMYHPHIICCPTHL